MKYEKKPISKILRSNNTVFTSKDVSLIWGNTKKKAVISAINYYVKNGELYRIRRGFYAKNTNYDKFELATKIYTPSYIGLETVLRQAGIVFQFYGQIFVASYLTREITADNQKYSYRKIKDSILTNQAGIEVKDRYCIASPERAFLDTLYLNKDYYFDNLGSLDKEKIFEILPIYKSKSLEKKVERVYGS